VIDKLFLHTAKFFLLRSVISWKIIFSANCHGSLLVPET